MPLPLSSIMVPQSGWGEEEEPSSSFIPHNPWLEPKGAPLVKLAAEIFAEIEAATERRSLRKPRSDALERRRQVILNIVASLAAFVLRSDYESSIAIDMTKDAKSRYDRPDFHPALFAQAFSAMEHEGLLSVAPGNFRQYRTCIMPTALFVGRLEAAEVTAGDLAIRAGGETIILDTKHGPDGRKALIDYVETVETTTFRREVAEIATVLNDADIRLDGIRMPPSFLTRRFRADSLNPPHLFNRHGRLWGGWWQNLKKDRRDGITINGETTCDLDFKACFLNLGYAYVGVPLPEGDPYAIEGLDVTYRPALKRAFAALLFRDGSKRARMPQAIHDALPVGWTMRRLTDALAKKHPAIAPLFGSGIGLEIMHTESEILVAALLDLARQGIPALGMHDGLAVAESCREKGFAAMKAASIKVLGVELPVVEKPIHAVKH